LQPSPAQPTPGVVEAIEAADLVVLGPGSLYTSVIPNLLAEGVGAALRETRAAVVMVANLVGEREETAGLDLEDHVRIVEEHAGGRIVDALVTHDGPIDTETAERYEAEGCFPLQWTSRVGDDLVVIRRNLLARELKMRHDPDATSEALMAAWRRSTQTEVMRTGDVAARSHDRGGRRWVPRSITN
jgi:uncharacterized cofD-like protein